jgi:membrane protease YdiL (CAAX protease family)
MALKKFILRYPIIAYFLSTFIISWLGALLLISPKLLSGQPVDKMDGLLMFPVMIIGPCLVSILLTAVAEGRSGLKNLWRNTMKWKVNLKWYIIAFIIPPSLILLTLMLLKLFVSSAFTPNLFLIGILFGIPAGFFEEIGWTGYALPKLRLKRSIIKSGLILGFLWGLWHIPVIDFLGAATPHGHYLIPFSAAFIAILVAMRLLMTWVHSHTNSILLAQFMHVISTGSLVILGPPTLSPIQETSWYALYAVLLLSAAFAILLINKGKNIVIEKK